MGKLIGTVGSTAGVLGVVVCLVSGLVRLAGNWHVSGIQTRTVFLVGIALMVAGCLGKLHELVDR